MAEALARGYEEAGYRGAMRRAAVALAARQNEDPFFVAQFYVRAGEKELAMDWLEQGFQSHSTNVAYLNVNPLWDLVRDHPRFKALIRELNPPA